MSSMHISISEANDDVPVSYWIPKRQARIHTEKCILPFRLLVLQKNSIPMTKIVSAVKGSIQSYCAKVYKEIYYHVSMMREKTTFLNSYILIMKHLL